MANTTNLGWQLPASPFVQSGPQVTWDNQWQNYQGGRNANGGVSWGNGGQAAQPPGFNGETGGYVDAQGVWHMGQSPRSQQPAPGVNVFGNGGNTQQTGMSIMDLLNKQMEENKDKEAKQQAAWDEEKKYMLGLPSQYANDPRTRATQGLVSNLLANPEALNDQTVGKIKNETANQIQSQTDNAFRQGIGTLAAGGATSARSINALRERLDRAGMAAQQTNNTNVEIQRANQRNQDTINAANLGRQQSTTDIGIPMSVGNTILANQPQYRPNDYSGLLALAQGQQQNNNINSLLAMMVRNQQSQQSPFSGVQSPTGAVGGRMADMRDNSTGAGFGWQSPFSPQNQRPMMVATA